MKVLEEIHGEGDATFTAHTFLQYMRRSSPHWWNNSSTECSWSFRGHGNAAWKLVPTAARPLNNLAPHQKSMMNFQRVVEQLETELSRQSLWSQMHEIRREQILRHFGMWICLDGFVKLAVDLGYTIDGYADFSSQINKQLGQVFREANVAVNNYGFLDWISNYPTCSETIALAQHHGVPTIFLDWTENPITACYFAAAGHGSAQNIAVWGINTNLLASATNLTYHMSDLLFNKRHGWIRLVRPQKSGNKYLSAQSGIMTFIAGFYDAWIENGAYPPLEEWVLKFEPENIRNKLEEIRDSKHPSANHYQEQFERWQTTNEPILRKVILSAEQVPELRKLLFREGISKAHLMPSLDNIAATALETVASNSIKTKFG